MLTEVTGQKKNRLFSYASTCWRIGPRAHDAEHSLAAARLVTNALKTRAHENLQRSSLI